MSPVYIFATIVIALLFLFLWFIFDRDFRKSIIMEDLVDDFYEKKRQVETCSPDKAESIINEFSEKWKKYVPGWILCDYTHELYRALFDRHGDNAILN